MTNELKQYVFENIGMIITIVLLGVAICFGILRLVEYFTYSNVAQESYQDIVETLRGSKPVCVKTLRSDLKDKYRNLQIHKLWSYIDKMRKQEQSIFQYEDVFEGVPQNFWILKD